MDDAQYGQLRELSSALFNNGLVLPVAWAICEQGEASPTVAAAEIRRVLSGRAENNQIREALKRLDEVGALRKLPHAGRPNPHQWVREPHPFWKFVADWISSLSTVKSPR